ncbi:hypothetical protein H6G36_16180 [Anabaena minutissima FACHB-250]|nr:hypothetical protein [Anabaena minutissima FACHB-250]
MVATITQEDNLIFQTYYTVLLLKELGEVKFEDSSQFDDLNLSSQIKQSLKDIGIQNQGSAIMVLYAMLVVPKEIIAQEFKEEYEKINEFLRTEVTLHQTTYEKEDENNLNSICFIRHVRNSVAHAKISFTPGVSVTFYDKKSATTKGGATKIEEICFSLPLNRFGDFLNSLQDVHLKYIQKRRNS